jgi:hypothetical protein
MKYFTLPFPVRGNAYCHLTKSRRNDITVGLQSSKGVSSRTSRQIPTKESDDAFIQCIEEQNARKADITVHQCGDMIRAISKGWKKVANKTLQLLRKEPRNITQAPKPEEKVSSFGEYPQPYVFW